MSHQRPQHSRRSVTLVLAAFVVCAVWPVTLAVLWLATGRILPTINVRGAPGTTDEPRSSTEKELSRLWYEPREAGTVRYSLDETGQQSLERIVLHPLVQDTAFINRGSFVLDNAPSARIWNGRQFVAPQVSGWLYLRAIGCLISGVVLGGLVLYRGSSLTRGQ